MQKASCEELELAEEENKEGRGGPALSNEFSSRAFKVGLRKTRLQDREQRIFWKSELGGVGGSLWRNRP